VDFWHFYYIFCLSFKLDALHVWVFEKRLYHVTLFKKTNYVEYEPPWCAMAILYELAPPPYNIETAPKHSTIQQLQ